MTYTQEQIDSMSPTVVRLAVMNKINGTKLLSRFWGSSITSIPVDQYDPINDPRDYMSIAIEYGISPNFGRNDYGKTVFCTYPVPKLDTRSFGMSSLYPRTDTGLAVCAAFLMMEV